MEIPRSAGILMHPTSLPGRLGVGELGHVARQFVDVLAKNGLRWWQILPLTPPDGMGSPYSSNSAFGSDVNLIDLEQLVADGLLLEQELQPLLDALEGEADDEFLVEVVSPLRKSLLKKAFQRFDPTNSDFKVFCKAECAWLDDYALFAALKDQNGGRHWAEWPAPLVRRDVSALETAAESLSPEITCVKFEQWLFSLQWQALLDYAHSKDVGIIGDIPIFVAMDSSDVWANRDLFDVDKNGKATAVAGVPPDYFSATGQLWGNPLYKWDVMEKRGFDWWFARIRRALSISWF